MKAKMKFPAIAHVARRLKAVKGMLDKGRDCDVRLQVYKDGEWAVRIGDSSYDQDHRGFWGASSVGRRSNCREVADYLIQEAFEHFAQSEDAD